MGPDTELQHSCGEKDMVSLFFKTQNVIKNTIKANPLQQPTL